MMANIWKRLTYRIGAAKFIGIQLIYSLLCFFNKKNKLIVIFAKNSEQFRNIPLLCDSLRRNDIAFCEIDQKVSLKNIFVLSQAKIVCIDQATSLTSNISLSDSTEVIQLWHAGGAYKKVGFDASDGSISDFKRIRRVHGNTKWMIITSNNLKYIYANAFHIPYEKILPLGMIRTDLYFKCCKKRKNNKLVLFAPTFRTCDKQRTVAWAEQVILDFKKKLRKYDYDLVVRLHPSVANQLSIDSELNWSDRDLTDCLGRISVLVTDYSSIFFDFSLFNGRIFWYIKDIEDYENERGVYFNPLIDYPAYADKDLDDLVEKIAKNNNNNCKHIRERFMNSCDGHSTQRIVSFIKSLL